MYSDSLGKALGYGNIGGSPRKRMFDGSYESPQNNGGASQYNEPSTPVQNAIWRPPARNQNPDEPLSDVYNEPSATTSPVAQTGYQSTYFTPTGNKRQDITNAYQNLLGRAPENEQAIQAHMNAPGGQFGYLDSIYNSPEYAQHSQQASQAPDPMQSALMPQANQNYGGSNFRMGGSWSQDKLNNNDQDIKYQIGRAVGNINPNDPSAINSVVAALNAQGIQVTPGPTFDTMYLPDGELVDIINGEDGDRGWWYGSESEMRDAGMGGLAHAGNQNINPLESAISGQGGSNGGGMNNILAMILTALSKQLGQG